VVVGGGGHSRTHDQAGCVSTPGEVQALWGAGRLPYSAGQEPSTVQAATVIQVHATRRRQGRLRTGSRVSLLRQLVHNTVSCYRSILYLYLA
jgi:hypothetical protein